MMIKCGCGKCGAGAPAREERQSEAYFEFRSIERARLQPGRKRAPKSGTLAPQRGRAR